MTFSMALGGLVSGNVTDRITLSNKFYSLSSVSSNTTTTCCFNNNRRKNLVLRKLGSSQITAVAKVHYFNVGRAETKKLLKGVNKLADLVETTYGPDGLYVLLCDPNIGAPRFVMDALSVARKLKLEDPVEDMGANVVTQTAEKIKLLTGDGTGTVVLLTRALFAEAESVVEAGAHPVKVARGMEKTSKALLVELMLMSRELKLMSEEGDVVKEEGIVVGGGCAFLRLAAKVDAIKATLEHDEKVGADVVKKAFSCPLKLIAKNSHVNGHNVIETVLANEDTRFGYNVVTGEFEDLIAAGISDPTKVVRCCMEHAISVANVLLTCDCFVVDRKNSDRWFGSELWKNFASFGLALAFCLFFILL